MCRPGLRGRGGRGGGRLCSGVFGRRGGGGGGGSSWLEGGGVICDLFEGGAGLITVVGRGLLVRGGVVGVVCVRRQLLGVMGRVCLLRW